MQRDKIPQLQRENDANWIRNESDQERLYIPGSLQPKFSLCSSIQRQVVRITRSVKHTWAICFEQTELRTGDQPLRHEQQLVQSDRTV